MTEAVESGQYFNEEQKAIKSVIMKELLAVMERNINDNMSKFNPEEVPTLITSILVMFNRDVLIDLFVGCGVFDHKITIPSIEGLHKAIKEQVLIKLRDIKEENSYKGSVQ